MIHDRLCGILLHPTSLPGPYGIGSLGENARTFVDILHQSEVGIWQILPLGPTGYGDSPYQCFSAFAGNPLLIDLDDMVKQGILTQQSINTPPVFPDHMTHYETTRTFKLACLQEAYLAFRSMHGQQEHSYVRFLEEQSGWIKDYALFQALKKNHGDQAWTSWTQEYRNRDPIALARAESEFSDIIQFHYFLQYQFFMQWKALHTYASTHQIQILGDMPIFTSHDSADVWAHPDLFDLNADGTPRVVAGVPPDYFSKTGQRWGNPLYRWEALKSQHYQWWIDRFTTLLHLVDSIRIDHFRGFESYWEIPSADPTARNGKWVEGPGTDFFETVLKQIGKVPIIAEDLGVITPEVVALRDAFHFPGMKILQFAFGSGPNNPYLPHQYSTPNCVVYTGTHDNDTTPGWMKSHKRSQWLPISKQIEQYIGYKPSNISMALMRLAFQSIARWAIVPAQDILNIGSEGRMNFPGKPEGNWQWRLRDFTELRLKSNELKELIQTFGRSPAA